MQVVTKKVTDLIPYVQNSRTHSDEQVAQIAASIKEFGWTNPIWLYDGTVATLLRCDRQTVGRFHGEKSPIVDKKR